MTKSVKIKITLFILLALGFALPAISVSKQERRVALVIGNGKYKTAALVNPPNDANDVAAALKKCNFKVIKKINVNRKQMRKAIRDFGDEINKGAVGLFYYAGHGIQVNGENFLIPIGAEVYSEDEVRDECLMVSSVLRKMESAGNSLNIIILDACRDNPFGRSFRSSKTGLAKMDAPTGSILAYATAPGSVAADGLVRKDRNGLFTSKFLKNIMTPGQKIEELFKQVRIDVIKDSKKKQVPWESSSLIGNFYFLASSGATIDYPISGSSDARFSLKANVSGAAVFLDGQRIGTTNLANVKVVPGEHRVKVEKEGYEPYRKTVRLKSGRSLTLTVWLEPEALAKSSLYVDAAPEDATVKILNIGPRFYQGMELDPGKYHLEVSAGGYETKQQWIQLDEGEDESVGIRLKKLVPPVWKGKNFSNSMGMKFKYIKPGSFMMGSPSGESGRDNDETRHRATLTRGYYLQTTEVTQGQWEAVMGTKPWSGEKYVRDNPNCPAVYISWDDCKEFIRKLNKKEGADNYRLPTEAEWEYACRAGSTTRFSFGNSDSLLGDYAWYCGNAWDIGNKYAHRVGGKKPNAWGLYDMHGNVWEWCRDWKGGYSGTVSDPTGPSSGSLRVFRGGSWGNGAGYCRSAYRGDFSPGYRYVNLGFRLARTF